MLRKIETKQQPEFEKIPQDTQSIIINFLAQKDWARDLRLNKSIRSLILEEFSLNSAENEEKESAFFSDFAKAKFLLKSVVFFANKINSDYSTMTAKGNQILLPISDNLLKIDWNNKTFFAEHTNDKLDRIKLILDQIDVLLKAIPVAVSKMNVALESYKKGIFFKYCPSRKQFANNCNASLHLLCDRSGQLKGKLIKLRTPIFFYASMQKQSGEEQKSLVIKPR